MKHAVSFLLLVLLHALFTSGAASQTPSVHAAPGTVATEFGSKAQDAKRIVVWGATDLDSFRPTIHQFLEANPGFSIQYHDMQSKDLYEMIRDGRSQQPDIAISSAADLQIKLVNDGLALEHGPPENVRIPAWANWRDQAFGISAEPAVIVYSKQLNVHPLPRSRQDLQQMIVKNLDVLKGKVATYDISFSGVGYLFATFDSLYSSTYTTLLQSFGLAKAQFYCCSGEILDAIDAGEILVGYNILGSYALERQSQGGHFEIVLPTDYTLILSRVAIIPKAATHPDYGGLFLDYLLSPEVQARRPGYTSYSFAEGSRDPGFTGHPIALNPSLLVYLDAIKRNRFLGVWRSLTQPVDRAER